MDTFSTFLDSRSADAGRAAHQAQRDAAALAWLNQGRAPEDRLPAFDAWCRRELATRLDWTWAGSQKERRIEQCRLCLEGMVLALWKRGWMLDGKRLAAHLTKCLDAVGAYQRAGKVADFWPYFRAAVDRYVGLNAEELQSEAQRSGVQIGQLLAPILSRQGQRPAARPPGAPSLPELVAQRRAEVTQAKAETLRGKIARQRALQAASKALAQQPQLF